MTDRVEVVVVGAGFAGVAAALRLRAAGHDVRIIERSGGLGGTWRENVYPGVACDVPAHLYSLAEHPHAGWSEVYAPGAEIRDYLENVVARTGLTGSIRFGTELIGADWDARDERWMLQLASARGVDSVSAEVLVLACGRLVEPRLPEVPGLDTFPGPVMHTARWDPSFDPTGRNIAVIGTGSSAVQLVPQLAGQAARVTVFQRTPAWIVPRGGGVYTDADRAGFTRHPESIARLRAQLLADDEERFAARVADRGTGAASAAARQEALDHLAAQVPEPTLRRRLTPEYPFGCKRVVRSDDFYPVLASGAAAFEPSALAGVEGSVVVAASGARYPDIDAIVLATGFHTAVQPFAARVRGEGGLSLAAHWSGGMTSFASTVVTGFPNLFVLNGPNAALAHTSSLLVLEAQAAYVERALALRADRGGVLRLRPEAEERYTALVDGRTRSTPWTAGCDSWYIDDRSGRVTLLWPGTVAEFRAMVAGAAADEFAPARHYQEA